MSTIVLKIPKLCHTNFNLTRFFFRLLFWKLKLNLYGLYLWVNQNLQIPIINGTVKIRYKIAGMNFFPMYGGMLSPVKIWVWQFIIGFWLIFSNFIENTTNEFVCQWVFILIYVIESRCTMDWMSILKLYLSYKEIAKQTYCK